MDISPLRRRSGVFLVAFGLAGISTAQISLQNEVVGSTGQTGTVSGITISATVGETIVATLITNAVILTQGFHQTEPAIVPVQAIMYDNWVTAFPNPATNFCIFQFDRPIASVLNCHLFNAQGREVLFLEMEAGTMEHRLDVSPLAAGTYKLVLHDRANVSEPSVFQLIKINP